MSDGTASSDPSTADPSDSSDRSDRVDRAPLVGRRGPLRWIGATLACAALALTLWAFWLEPASLTVRESEILLPRWPHSCDGLRIAVLADLHVGSPFNGIENLETVVARTSEAAPDLVLLVGDYVIQGVLGGHFVSPEDAAAVLARLAPTWGSYAVLGNHDWWLDSVRVGAALDAEGIATLEDRSVTLRREGCEFWLAGISDYWEGPHDYESALASVPRGAPLIAFTHNPDLFVELPPSIDLTLAGHTHGGQVHLPLLGRPIVPSRYGERYAIGHVVEDGRHLFVSSGIGTSILPVRFRVAPEISIVTLRSAAPRPSLLGARAGGSGPLGEFRGGRTR